MLHLRFDRDHGRAADAGAGKDQGLKGPAPVAVAAFANP